MSPEEKFNQEVWFVLGKIKKSSFYRNKDEAIRYSIKSPPDLKNEGMPFPVEEQVIVNKLEYLGAIKIIPPNDIAEISDSETSLSKGLGVFIVIMYLKILQPKFDEVYEDYKNRIIDTSIPKGDAKFDDDQTTLVVGNKKCPFPPFKNEHYFCRAMFRYLVDEPVDWSTIYEQITGEKEVKNERKNKRMVYDTYEAVNKRVKQILGIEHFFVWENKTIKRTQ